MLEQSKVSFFIEQHPESQERFYPGATRPELLKQILNPSTCKFLEERGWGISLATIELDEATAKVIQDLNRDHPGLPITMWIVLPDEKGYWTNETNIAQTRTRVSEVESWTSYFDLKVAGYGLDIEPSILHARRSLQGPFDFVREHIKRVQIHREMRRAGENPSQELAELIDDLRKTGVHTETYEFHRPLVTLLGLPNVTNADTRYSLIYTSGFPEWTKKAIVMRGLKPGTQPAFGNFSSTGVSSGRIVTKFESVAGKQDDLVRDINWIAQKGKKDRLNYLNDFKVFALTGIEVARWTDEVLKRVR